MQQLREDIVVLRMLTAEPARPTRNPIVSCRQRDLPANAGRVISFQQEHEIVDNLAFLSAISDDPEKVTAIWLDEGLQPDSCTIRIAMNTRKLTHLVADFGKIARVLERADHKSEPRIGFFLRYERALIFDSVGDTDNLNDLLSIVIPMHRNRVLSRLRSVHAKTYKKADRCAILFRLRDMINGLESANRSNLAVHHVKSTTTQLVGAFADLESMPTGSVTTGKADDILLGLLHLLDNLPSARDLTEILANLTVSAGNHPQAPETVVMTITKLRKYRAACGYLVRAAKCLSVFRNISVSEVIINPHVPQLLAGSEHLLSACLKRMGLDWDKNTKQRFGIPLSEASARFRKEMERPNSKVHAEIQLLFFYEMNPHLQCPRVVCSSKSACFLCDVFIRLHGKFFAARTHGVLYPKWTIPDINRLSLPEDRRQAMDKLIREFDHVLRNEIRRNLTQPGTKRRHPSESLATLHQWKESDLAVEAKQEPRLGQLSGSTHFDRAAIPLEVEDETRVDRLIHDDSSSGAKQEASMTTSRQFPLCPTRDDKGSVSHLSELQPLLQVRSFIDLDCQQNQTAHTIRDHESRTHDLPSKYDMMSMSRSAGMGRNLHFHDLELHFEFEHPATTLQAMRSSNTPNSNCRANCKYKQSQSRK
ncbi:uncharacterized protein Z518_06928 [Rhinocladiella mackenziei CBS 650.93]|uniref:Uncharacterized protein n=1 Tax=Rhinocladiella mackenziei CBS 650.93 TaxID=1442369 RepID=A0A0D2IJE6_9EURO|nr:uncharacterized protein Z518_06928 [Rhinocladiella mackenziei CBS 650.93]KIX03376.1 hypothetical protein Z518_06928 [Rhinocladiella mackenziei CBS 650.93]